MSVAFDSNLDPFSLTETFGKFTLSSSDCMYISTLSWCPKTFSKLGNSVFRNVEEPRYLIFVIPA